MIADSILFSHFSLWLLQAACACKGAGAVRWNELLGVACDFRLDWILAVLLFDTV
jgi:hypothetical protein